MIASLAGGVLIGLSASILLLVHGRTAGISGVVGGALRPPDGDLAWRLLFLCGLIGGGLLIEVVRPSAFPMTFAASPTVLIIAGLLVGFGTQLGRGCTSGHGVCGLGRRSTPSLIATITFMATGAATVFVARHLLGGGR
jgi:uncharacterized membrane protein YedE/YeeE